MWFNLAKMWGAQALANKRRWDNTGADEIAHAIHRMVDAMQPNAVQSSARVAPTRVVTIEDFIRHRPSKFTGKATPRDVKKICTREYLRIKPATGRKRILKMDTRF